MSPALRPGARFARVLGLDGRSYLLASAPFVVAFGIVPLSLYAHSGEEWAFAPELLLWLAGLGLLAVFTALLVLRLIAVGSLKTAKALAIGLFCLGVFLLLAHVYAPVAINPLDGSATTSDEPHSYTLLEGILLVGAVFLFRVLWRGRGLAMAGVFAGALWLVGLGYLAAILLPAEDAGAEALLARTSSRSLSSAPSCPLDSNVYQIVLDGLATDAALEVIESNGWRGEFDGFDLFFNNVSNYLRTVNSKASYLTGTLYGSGDLRDWQKSWAEGLLRQFAESGFGIWMYAPMREWKRGNPYVDVFRSNVGVYSERRGALQGEFYEFLSVWLTSLAPNVLTNEVTPVAADLADRLFTLQASGHWRVRLQGRRAGGDGGLLRSGFHGVASALLLEQVALDEPDRQPGCQYLYAHALLPHPPLVVDGRCRYAGKWQTRPEKISGKQAYLQQAECGLREVIGFLRVLKKLGRYDSATIVLHGDHGSTLHFRSSKDHSGAEILGWPKSGLLAHAQALLMVKRPRAQQPLQVVERPTQLVDIYPTVFDVLGLEQPAEVHGRSVYAPAAPPREARFAFDPEDPFGQDLIEVRIDDPTDLATSSLTVVGPPVDPGVGREEVPRAAPAGAAPVVSGIRKQ